MMPDSITNLRGRKRLNTLGRMECRACDLCRGSGHRTAKPVRSCCTTASTVRWSVHAKLERTELHSRALAKHCTVDLRHRSVLGIPYYLNLNGQMLPHHLSAQFITLARRHHRSFGHHHILLRQPRREVEPLFDEQNGEPP